MISIKPELKETIVCPHCSNTLNANKVIWQGIHVCLEFSCKCAGNNKFIVDLSTGHAMFSKYVVDVGCRELHGPLDRIDWFGQPLLDSILKPNNKDITFKVEKLKSADKVVIINCIDYLYGHSLLKLLNCQRHQLEDPDINIVVIAQENFRWMVPKNVAEIWTVGVNLSDAQQYYPRLAEKIEKECLRFTHIYVSKNHPHPQNYDISSFTGVTPFNNNHNNFRITFIWRSDRLWVGGGLVTKIFEKINLKIILEYIQALKIIILFRDLKKSYSSAKFTVIGIGRSAVFPKWVDDKRLENFKNVEEVDICNIYSQSKLVVGVHGSNMLLPSGHAHVSLVLMPKNRWGNFMQDILVNEPHSLTALYKYRYLPVNSTIKTVAEVIRSALSKVSSAMPVNLFN